MRTFNQQRILINGIDKRVAMLIPNKGKQFHNLFIEDLRGFNKFNNLEEYLLYKWSLIEKMYTFEKMCNSFSSDLFEEIWRKFSTY